MGAGGRIAPLAVVADGDRDDAGVSDPGRDVDEGLARLAGVFDGIAGGLACGQEQVVALVVAQGAFAQKLSQLPAQGGDRACGR